MRWVEGPAPVLHGCWDGCTSPRLEMGEWNILGYVFPAGCEAQRVPESDTDHGQPVPLLRLPNARLPLQLVPIEWLDRVVVLGRIRGSVEGLCALLEPSRYFLMVPRATATLAMQHVGPPGRQKLRKVVNLPALGDAARMTSTPHGDTNANADAGIAMLRTRGRRGHAVASQETAAGRLRKRSLPRDRASEDRHDLERLVK
jgi:hypothetical protein